MRTGDADDPGRVTAGLMRLNDLFHLAENFLLLGALSWLRLRDCALDHVLGDGIRTSLLRRRAQSRFLVLVPIGDLGGEVDSLQDPGNELRSHGDQAPLAVRDVSPIGVVGQCTLLTGIPVFGLVGQGAGTLQGRRAMRLSGPCGAVVGMRRQSSASKLPCIRKSWLEGDSGPAPRGLMNSLSLVLEVPGAGRQHLLRSVSDLLRSMNVHQVSELTRPGGLLLAGARA